MPTTVTIVPRRVTLEKGRDAARTERPAVQDVPETVRAAALLQLRAEIEGTGRRAPSLFGGRRVN